MSYVKNIFHTLNRNIGIQLISIVSSIIIARILQPEGKGIVTSYRVTADIVASITSLGLSKALTYYSAKEEVNQQSLINTSLYVAVLTSILAMLGFCLIQYSSSGYKWSATELSLVAATLPTVFFSNIIAWNEGIFRGKLQFSSINSILFTQNLVAFLLFLLLLITKSLNPIIVLLVYSFTTFLSFVAAIFIQRHTLQNISLKVFDFKILLKLLKYGFFYQSYGVLQRLHYSFDLILINQFLGKIQLGLYSTGVSMAQLSWQIPLAVVYVLVPTTSGDLNDNIAIHRTAKTARISTALLLVVVGIMGLSLPHVITIVYGKDYAPAVQSTYFLLPGMVASGVFMILASFLGGRGKLNQLAFVSCICLFLNTALNFLLILKLGIIGASISSSISYTLSAVIIALLLGKKYNLNPLDFFVPKISDFNQFIGKITEFSTKFIHGV